MAIYSQTHFYDIELCCCILETFLCLCHVYLHEFIQNHLLRAYEEQSTNVSKIWSGISRMCLSLVHSTLLQNKRAKDIQSKERLLLKELERLFGVNKI